MDNSKENLKHNLFNSVNWNFLSKLVFANNLLHLFKQCYGAKKLAENMSLNIDKTTMTFEHFGTFDPTTETF